MSPIEIIWEVVSSKLEDTEFWPSIVVGAVIFLVLLGLLAKLKKWQYRVGAIAMAAGLIAAEFNLLLKWHYTSMYLLAGLLFGLPILYFLIVFLRNQYQLCRIAKLSRQPAYVEALELLNTIKPEQLVAKQLQVYQRRRFFLLVNLGSIRKAKVYLEEICQEKGAFYHFSLHILAFRIGDLKTSLFEIQAAEDSDDLKDDPLLQFQIIVNHGVCYAAEKNYHLADEYYNKANAFLNDHHLRDEELLETFYYNVAFNRLRLSPETTDWQTALDECQSKLDMKKPDAQIRMLNLRLELLRQTEAPREVIDDLLQEAFSKITGGKLPIKNQVIFASSAARVAWAARVNPIPCLKFLWNNISVIEHLPANQRYHVYAELEILFRDFHGPDSDPFAPLRDQASEYLRTEAENDLRTWQNSLPPEAIYDRCYCLIKMANLCRNRTSYKRESVVSLQQNAIRLYHDNELYLDELRTRQDIMDELLDERNRDEDYRPKCMDEMREQLSSAENLLSQLTGHPALVESYIRLGCYCLDLDEYEKSICYARLFWETGISVQNFAPWLRRYYAILLLHVRVILFDKAIKEAVADKRLCSFGEDVKNWFATYPQHDGMLDALLLGRFLSIPVGKTKIWIPNGGSEPKGHTWLWIPQLEINIDLTYPQFDNDQLCQRMFFYQDRHPFEAGTSLTLQISQQISHFKFHGIVVSQLDNEVSAEMKSLLDIIYDFICDHIPKDCPTMEEFIQLITEFMEPVPIRS